MLSRSHTPTEHEERKRCPPRGAMEAQIRADINSAGTLAELKKATIDALLGSGGKKGIIDLLQMR